MKPARRLLTAAVAAALGAATFGVGNSLFKDVQFARAKEDVAAARQDLATVGDISNVYKAVNHAMERSVVQLVVRKTVHNTSGPQMRPQDLFKFFGPNGQGVPPQLRRGQPDPDNTPDDGDDNNNNDQSPGDAVEMATGSGCIMDVGNGEGYVVTNNHVVSDATDVTVVLSDGRRVENATVVATDPKTDLAVVKIKADRLIAAKWGDSDQLEKGDVVVAFGSPFGFVGSMSHGIVSALNRDNVMGSQRGQFSYENFIQVDAAINPGNSGGPLCNIRGEVVGINTAIASRTGSFAGIGFAIPSDQAKQVYESLKTQGKVVRGYLGVGIIDINNADDPTLKTAVEQAEFKGDTGIMVRQVMSDSPAMDVLQPGDIITAIDGKPLKTMTELRTKIANDAPGTDVKLTVWRDKAFKDVTVKLATQPEQMASNEARQATPARPQQMGNIGLSVTTPTAADLEAAGLPAGKKGALVQSVKTGSLADLYGIQPGDLITRAGAQPIASADDLKAALTKADLNKGLRLDLLNKEGLRMVTMSKKALNR